jgi:hypothetical protein
MEDNVKQRLRTKEEIFDQLSRNFDALTDIFQNPDTMADMLTRQRQAILQVAQADPNNIQEVAASQYSTQVKGIGIQETGEGDRGPHFAITLRADLADQLKG